MKLLLFLLVLPAAAALPVADTTYQFESHDQFVASVLVRYEGRDARMERSFMDADQDGTVTAAEVDAFESRQADSARAAGLSPPAGLFYSNEALFHVVHARLDASGAVGPVDPVPFTEQWMLRMEAPEDGGLVRIDADNRSAGGHLRVDPGRTDLLAPRGMMFAATGGLPFGAQQTATRIAFQGDAQGWLTLQFTDAPRTTPFPLPLAVLALLVVLRHHLDV